MQAAAYERQGSEIVITIFETINETDAVTIIAANGIFQMPAAEMLQAVEQKPKQNTKLKGANIDA